MIRPAISFLALLVVGLPASASGGVDDVSLSSLQPGERVEISYKSQGCFSNSQAEMEFTPDGVYVSGLIGGGENPTLHRLSTNERSKLDAYLQRLRKGELNGGCTTTDAYTVRIWKDGNLINSYSGIDGSCVTSMAASALSPGMLVHRIENQALREARAKAEGK